MAEEGKKKRSIWEKLILGAVIGGAIGSVLGATIAPKKGEDTRKELKETVEKTKKGAQIIIGSIRKKLLRSKEPENDVKQIPNEMEKQ